MKHYLNDSTNVNDTFVGAEGAVVSTSMSGHGQCRGNAKLNPTLPTTLQTRKVLSQDGTVGYMLS
jgi:hypothetical protein